MDTSHIKKSFKTGYSLIKNQLINATTMIQHAQYFRLFSLPVNFSRKNIIKKKQHRITLDVTRGSYMKTLIIITILFNAFLSFFHERKKRYIKTTHFSY